MTSMETELKSLRIDRSAKRSDEPKAVSKLIAIAVVVALLAIGTTLAYRKLNAATPVHVVQVQSPVAASSTGEQNILTVTGYIIAAHKIEVASKVNGRVAWIGVDKGDHVKAGQVLVRLEDDEYRAQVIQQKGNLEMLQAKLEEALHGSRPEEIAKARADVNQAKADLSDSKASLDRTKQLVEQGVLAKQQLDDAQAKYDADAAKVNSLQRTLDLSVLGPRKEEIDQIRGQIDQARGALDYAQTQLDNTVIKAPITGTILDRNVERANSSPPASSATKAPKATSSPWPISTICKWNSTFRRAISPSSDRSRRAPSPPTPIRTRNTRGMSSRYRPRPIAPKQPFR